MKCTIHATEPSIVEDACPGDLFVLREAGEGECVCALVAIGGDTDNVKLVVIGSRVEEGEPGFHHCGALLIRSRYTPIQFVEAVEKPAFRERGAELNTQISKALSIDFQARAIVETFDREAIHQAFSRVMHLHADESTTVPDVLLPARAG